MSPVPALELALETSRRETSLALGDGERVLRRDVGAEAHASGLLAALEPLLASFGPAASARPLPLARIFVGLGPGSYTGLRVGLATAQALAYATGAELYGLPSFEALAFARLAPGESGSVAFDGRAASFYHARYRRVSGGLDVLAPLLACDAALLASRVRAEEVLLAHPGLCESAGLASTAAARVELVAPEAGSLLELGRLRRAAGALAPARALEPLYLRAFGEGPRRSV